MRLMGLLLLYFAPSFLAGENCEGFVKKVAYYAHPISLYDSPQEQRDIELIMALGFGVLNPNAPEHQRAYETEGMLYFDKLIREKGNLLVFRAFPNGSIPAGIAKEIETAREMSFPVIELPNSVSRRSLSVEETREFLRESGYR